MLLRVDKRTAQDRAVETTLFLALPLLFEHPGKDSFDQNERQSLSMLEKAVPSLPIDLERNLALAAKYQTDLVTLSIQIDPNDR